MPVPEFVATGCTGPVAAAGAAAGVASAGAADGAAAALDPPPEGGLALFCAAGVLALLAPLAELPVSAPVIVLVATLVATPVPIFPTVESINPPLDAAALVPAPAPAPAPALTGGTF